MEVVVTISLGLRAGSLALIAFGLDSVIEIFASTVVIRNLRDDRSDPGDRRVHRSLRLIAVAFWVLATFLVVMSLRGLIRGDHPDSAPWGVAYLALTAVAMFGLARLKHETATEHDIETLQAEAALTFLDGCLSTGILIALVLNAWLGWWWTDAAAALLVAAFARQGRARPLARIRAARAGPQRSRPPGRVGPAAASDLTGFRSPCPDARRGQSLGPPGAGTRSERASS